MVHGRTYRNRKGQQVPARFRSENCPTFSHQPLHKPRASCNWGSVWVTKQGCKGQRRGETREKKKNQPVFSSGYHLIIGTMGDQPQTSGDAPAPVSTAHSQILRPTQAARVLHALVCGRRKTASSAHSERCQFGRTTELRMGLCAPMFRGMGIV